MSTYPRGLERTQTHLAVDRASKRYEGERKSFSSLSFLLQFFFNSEAQEERSNGEKRDLGKKEV